LKEILLANYGFQGVEMHVLSQIGLFSCFEEAHVSLKRKPSKIEAEVSSILFPCEN
jgi:hypothetical protein